MPDTRYPIPLPARRARALWFRTLAVALSLSPLVACELVLRAGGWGKPSWHDDPFVGFRAVTPLFELNSDGTRYEIPPARLKFFSPESFAADKPQDEYRIFVLGGSTVQGEPYLPQTSFTTWLEISLQAADPSRRWEVVNCGGVSYASYRLLPIMQELMARQPDLFIFYEGHNEFLEDRTYEHIKHAPRLVAAAQESFGRLRTYTVLRDAVLRSLARDTNPAPARRPLLPAEVEALLDYRGGLEEYHRDPAWQRDVIGHWEHNLRRMAGLCREAGVPLLLVNPTCNLRDCPPFKSEHRDDLTPDELAQFQAHWKAAQAKYRHDLPGATELLRQAVAIDDQHAAIWFDLGTCYEALGDTAEARAAFIRAKELDICPLRVLEPMRECIFRVGAETGTPVADVGGLFDQLSRGGIPGKDWLVDHVHPTIAGHQKIAGAILEKLVEMRIVRPLRDWENQRDRRYQEHFDSLEPIYFLHAEQRLRGLEVWAHGRRQKERPRSRGRRG
jgi:tetratricopeptide (TPR) repeat protein